MALQSRPTKIAMLNREKFSVIWILWGKQFLKNCFEFWHLGNFWSKIYKNENPECAKLLSRKFLVGDFSRKILKFPHCDVATFGTNSSLSNDCFLSESFGAFAEMAIILLSLFRVFMAKNIRIISNFLPFYPKIYKNFTVNSFTDAQKSHSDSAENGNRSFCLEKLRLFWFLLNKEDRLFESSWYSKLNQCYFLNGCR